ncbi:methyltransferase domain-containing protein [Rhodococcus sp. NPDC058532]|uniref:methyltransferase domain-containing protein n=1 Tax=Rhodococcus sp. NPDC058532 TaxID=3346540 RepID=UPI00366A1D71
MTRDGDQSPTVGIGEMLISSRSLDEYKAMFNLTERDLSRKILDCPGGAAGLTSAVNRLGGDVTACDMAYFDRKAEQLAGIVAAETCRGNRYIRANLEHYDWTFFADPDEHLRLRQHAVEEFAADITRNPHRYVAGRLPALPFPDASFDLVVSSHLLFSYSDRLDLTFHLEALTELMRVSRSEVRIFPLVASGSAALYPHLDTLLTDLRGRGVEGEVVEVEYRFQRGAHHMLVCRHITQ